VAWDAVVEVRDPGSVEPVYDLEVQPVENFLMTTPAERPYGTPAFGSKYQEQEGPAFSHYFENCPEEDFTPAACGIIVGGMSTSRDGYE
jgi:hypothetical protein